MGLSLLALALSFSPASLQVQALGQLTAQLTADPPEALTRVGEHRFVATARPDMQFTLGVRNDRVTRVRVVGPDGAYQGARTGPDSD
jgi:hypothetical protein